jgi:hypothetical protein
MLKKRLIILGILICIFLFFSIVGLSNNTKYDFRKTNWGMSKEQVKATEDKKPDLEDDTLIAYKVKIDAKDFVCVYNFLEDKLYHSGYCFVGEHINENLYIDDYEELKETLTKKYGKPKTEKVIWKNDLYKNDKSEWGFAISLGDLVYVAQWETSTTIIGLYLSGDNYEIGLNLFYDSKELKEWANKIKEEKAKEDF